ncbi:MAG: hypothetical protein JWN03_3350 [Nocardia sp.]|nr:hypothetical protein [Nocardia sp.]
MKTAVRKASWSVTTIAVVAAALAPAVVHAAVPDPVVNDCASYPAQSVTRPANLLLACGDGGLWVKNIAWSSWGPDTAEGDGIEYRRVCVPDCATGGVSTGPTHITLRNLDGGRFKQAVISDLNGKPETWPL